MLKYCKTIIYILFLIPQNLFAIDWVGACERDYPPYNFIENGKYLGIDTEIVTLVMKKLKINFSIQTDSWDTVYRNLKENKYDFAWQFVDTPARRKLFHFVGPIRYGLDVFVVKSNSNITNWKNMQDFDGMKAGVIKTYNYDHKFDTAKNFTKVQFNNMNELLKGLINNKVDFIIGDFNTILFIANKNNYNDKIRFLPSSIKKVPRYIAFSKKSKHKALYFDIKLKEIINSKEYNDIIEKYENIFKNRR